MEDVSQLKDIQLDALREVANIGAGHAATALSQMIGGRIMISVPRISVSALEEVPRQLAAPEDPIAAVLMHMLGDLTGRTLLIFPLPTAKRLAELMLRRALDGDEEFTDLEQSAVKECGNILSAAYMNALSEFMGMMLIPSPPSLAVDMWSAVITSAYLQFTTEPNFVVCVESEFVMDDSTERLRGLFLLLPDAASLHAILRAVRLA